MTTDGHAAEIGDRIPVRRSPWAYVGAFVAIPIILAFLAMFVLHSAAMTVVWASIAVFVAGAAAWSVPLGIVVGKEAFVVVYLVRRHQIVWTDVGSVDVRRAGISGPATALSLRSRDGRVAARVGAIWLTQTADEAAEFIRRALARGGPA